MLIYLKVSIYLFVADFWSSGYIVPSELKKFKDRRVGKQSSQFSQESWNLDVDKFEGAIYSFC